MPYTPGSLERMARRSKAEFIGEEGILHRSQTETDRLFIKHWYAYHNRFDSSAQSIRDIEPDALRTKPESDVNFSPYWHKLRYHEQAIIHRLFPEHTLEMVSAYDPRIDPKQAGTFDVGAGLPVTVTREVTVDPAKAETFQKILNHIYQVVIDHQRIHGKNNFSNPLPEDRLAALEQQLVAVSDDSFTLPRTEDAKHYFDKLLDYAHTNNTENILVPMLEAGILPVHPAVNFLPTAGQKSQPPHGVFVELTIMDPHRLTNAIQRQPISDRKTLNTHLERLTYWEGYDALYDLCIVRIGRYLPPEQTALIKDPIVTGAAFGLLETLRKRHEMRKRDGKSARELDGSDYISHFRYTVDNMLSTLSPIELTDPYAIADCLHDAGDEWHRL